MANKSYVTIRLDTTPPDISIIMPSYVVAGITQEIIIEANETVLRNATIYTIDSNGNRTNYIFDHQGNRFVGYDNFVSYGEGIITMYAQVEDLVGHKSILASHEISIKPTFNLIIINDELTNSIKHEERIMELKVTDYVRDINIATEVLK